MKGRAVVRRGRRLRCESLKQILSTREGLRENLASRVVPESEASAPECGYAVY